MPDPHVRAADTDREAVAADLGKHMAAGRLTLAEYDERVAQAYAARTYGDLAALTADLPPLPSPPAQQPATPAQTSTGASVAPRPAAVGHAPSGVPAPVAPQPPARPWSGYGGHGWRAWLATSVTVLAIYLATAIASGDFQYFWPIWVIGPWGAALLAQRITSGGARRENDRPNVDH